MRFVFLCILLLGSGCNRVTTRGLTIDGGSFHGGRVDSHGDHRVAMAFAVASVSAQSPIEILDTHHVATSFPGFLTAASDSGLRLETTSLNVDD